MSNTAIADRPEQGRAGAKHRFTVSAFHRMAEVGILGEDDRVELIDGDLLDMAPIGSKHAATVAILSKVLTTGARERCIVFVQNPLQMPDYNEPLPDLTLLKPRADSYRDGLPQPPDVLLVIEVADSSLGRDRDVKIPIYGHHGIPETWLVDVQRSVVTVYRQPSADGYLSVTEIDSGSVAPGCLPDVAIALRDLFG